MKNGQSSALGGKFVMRKVDVQKVPLGKRGPKSLDSVDPDNAVLEGLDVGEEDE